MSVELFLSVVGLAAVVIFAWWLVMLVDALRHPAERWEQAGQSRLLYVLLMVFLGAIGALVYALVARPRLRAALIDP